MFLDSMCFDETIREGVFLVKDACHFVSLDGEHCCRHSCRAEYLYNGLRIPNTHSWEKARPLK